MDFAWVRASICRSKKLLSGFLATASVYFVSVYAQAYENSSKSDTAGDNASETGILSASAYVAGAALCMTGFLSLRKKANNSVPEPSHRAVIRICLGLCLCALPIILQLVFHSTGSNESAAIGLKGSSRRL